MTSFFGIVILAFDPKVVEEIIGSLLICGMAFFYGLSQVFSRYLKELDVIFLLENCPHMDYDTLNKGGMFNGKTALYLASHEGNVELVKALLEQDNIDVNKGRE